MPERLRSNKWEDSGHTCPIWKWLNSKNSPYGLVQFWLFSGFFSSNYFQIGQHVVLLHILLLNILITHLKEAIYVVLFNRSISMTVFSLFLSVFTKGIFFVPILPPAMCRPFGRTHALRRMIPGMVTLIVQDPIRSMTSQKSRSTV